jgi:hypothetical protein
MAEKDKKVEKFYTPEEVAVAILKKTQELLKASSSFKANTSHEIEVGEEPNNDDAECPPSLEEADIEDSGAHGEKKAKKSKKGLEGADKDGDGDIDGDDAIEAQEELTGEDLDKDGEIGEPEDQSNEEKIDAASKDFKKPMDEDKDADEKIDDASEEKPEKDDKKEAKKPPFMKSEKGVHREDRSTTYHKPGKKYAERGISTAGIKTREAKHPRTFNEYEESPKAARAIHQEKLKELKEMPKPNLPKSEDMKKDLNTGTVLLQSEKSCKNESCEPKTDLKKPSLKKFMMKRKMKKCGEMTKSSGPTSDSRAAEKLSGAPPAPAPQEKIKEQPSPAAKVKAQPKMQLEKNKETEKLLGIKSKAGK